MLLAALATVLGATVQTTTGFGFALIAGPVLFLILAPGQAVTMLLLLGAVLNVLVLFGERRARRVRRQELLVVCAAATPGLVAGVLILHAVPKPALQIGVGFGVLATVVFQARRPAVVPVGRPSARARVRRSALAVGAATGILTTSTGTNGPPLLLFLQHRTPDPHEVRDTITAGFLGLNALGAITLVGLVSTAPWPSSSLARADAAAGGQHVASALARLRPGRFHRVLSTPGG